MDRDLNNSTTTNLRGTEKDISIKKRTVDEVFAEKETKWIIKDFTTNFGYYKEIPELKKAIDALAMWTAGKGFQTDLTTKIDLEHIQGWGEDTFDSILQNMIIIKKICGDSFAEIIRDEETGILINLKPLNPQRISIVLNDKGIIIAYEYMSTDGKTVEHRFDKSDIFHLCNDRVASEIHGVSVIEACKWVIDAKNEAMRDWRRILHRSTLRVIYIDADDPTKLNTAKTQYADAIKNGEVLVLPGKRGDTEVADYSAPPVATFLEWIRYLDNFFYQALGVPKVILGGSQEFTEASSKVGYLTFEQVYASEQRLLEQDLWNQLQIRVTFERPVSLKEDIVTSEAGNTGQVGFQANELTATVGRNE